MNNCEAKEAVPISEMKKEYKVERYEIKNINARLTYLEKKINVLTVVNNTLAKGMGMKVEMYGDVVVVTTI